MAATGGGKIRSRRYKISAKPYAKITQPGLISRVTDTVKSIVPSWLQKYFTNSDVAEGGGAVDQNSVAPPPPNGSEEGPPPPLDGRDSPEPSTSNTEPSTSRASLNFQDTVLLRPPLNRTHLHFPPLDLSSSALGAPSGLFSLPSTSSAPGPFSTGFSLVKEIKDNLSQHEDDNISTTSGFSSRASDKDIPVSKTASLPQLWSPPGTDRTHSGPQTTHSGLKKPTFNLSVFGSSSNSLKSSLLSSSQLGDSPFYPGKTTYGGAAAARSVLRTRLNQRPATPYQPPVRRQIKAKPAGAQPCGVTSATARRILQSLEHMSSPLADAKRIPSAASSLRLSASLDGTNLDLSHFQSKRKRMDSQLPPVQKLVVPTAVSVSGNRSVSFRPSLTPRAPKDTPTRQSPQLPDAVPGPSQSTTSSSGPTYPLSSTPAVSNAGSGGGKMKRERTTTRPSSKRPHDEEETVEVPDLPAISLPISSLPVFSFAPPPLPVTPAAKEPLADKEPPPASTAAPCVPFTFASPIVMATAASPPSSFSPSAGFTFSAPVAKMDLSISNDMLHTPVLAAVKLTNSTEEFDGPFKPAKTLKQGSVLDILKAHMDGNGFATPVASPVPDTPSQPIIAEPTASSSSSVGFGDQFKAPAGSWDCDVCMLRNKPADTKCVACNSSSKLPDSKPPPAAAAAPAAPLENNTAGFVAMFAAPPTGTWGCDTCLVQNKPEAVKCVACETAKPGTGAKPPPPAKTESAVATAGFGDKFKKAEGAWECATCMVENKAQESKCVACTTAKPGAAPSPAPLLGFGDKFKKAEGSATVEPKAIGASAFRVSAFGTMFPEAAPSPAPLLGFGDKFKKAEGSWDCDVCCVQNQAAALQCVACQSTRPGATVEPKAFGASAFGASSESGAGGFKFGSSSNSTSGFGGFKFPGTPSDSTSSSSTDGFKFGASFGSSSSEASKDTCGSSGFKFGGSSKGFKFGASAPTPADDPTPDPPAVGSGFKFGAPSGAGGGGFSFGLSKPAEEEAAASTTTTTTPPPPPPVGLPAEESGGGGAAETTSTTSGAAGPVFGRLGESAAPAEQEAAAPTFSFGKPAEKDAATAGFLFSGKEAEATTGGSFSFSKPDPPKEQQPQPPAFTFGKPADKSAAPEAPKPSFSFGQSAADTAASKPAFAFMANATAATTTTSSSSCSTTPALSLFGTAGLGSPAATLSPFLLPLAPTPFQDTPPAKTFLFGQSQDSAAPVAPSMNSTPSQPFLFGAAAGTAPPAAPSFAFGAAAPPAASSAAPSAAPAPFVFSSPSSGGFGATQTPSFGSFALPPPTFSTGSSQAPPAFGSKPNATVFPQAAAFGAAPGPAFGLGSTCRFGAPSTNTGVFAFGGAAAPPTPSVAPSFAQPAFNTGSAQSSSFPASPAGPPTIAGRKIKTAVRRRK